MIKRSWVGVVTIKIHGKRLLDNEFTDSNSFQSISISLLDTLTRLATSDFHNTISIHPIARQLNELGKRQLSKLANYILEQKVEDQQAKKKISHKLQNWDIHGFFRLQ